MRRRLLFSLLTVALLSIAAFAVPTAFSERTRITNAALADLAKHTDRIAQVLPEDFEVRPKAIRLPTDDEDLMSSVYSREGYRVGGDGPDQADASVKSALSGKPFSQNKNGALVRAAPIFSGNKVIGAVRAEEPTTDISNQTRNRLLTLVLQSLAVLLLAGLAAILIARRLARPLTSFHDAAVRLGEGDFSVRVPPSGIIELDQSAHALNAAAVRIGDLVGRERAFSADVSHQLRTPITSLRVTLETEQLTPRSDPTAVLRDAMKEVDRLESTVRDLLALSRDAPTDRQPLPLIQMIRTVEQVWIPRLHGAHRRLSVVADRLRLEQGEGAVYVSRSAVEQILDVLLSNALTHGQGTVTLRVLTTGDHLLELSVEDEGTHVVNPETVFDRRTGDGEGQGIGLAFAATLAQAEGGTLTLVSNTAKTTFQLVFPKRLRADRNTVIL